MREEFSHQTGSAEVTALHDINQLYDVGVLESLQKVVLPLYFGGLGWQEHFDGHFLLVAVVASFEDVGIATPPNFVGKSVLFKLSG